MLKAGTEDSGRIFIRHGLYRRGPVRLCEAVQCVERNVCGGSDTRIAHGRLPNVDTIIYLATVGLVSPCSTGILPLYAPIT
jgi:hypothetical protein